MNNILIAAMLQSEQTWLPVLQQPTLFDTVIKTSGYSQKLIAHCMENNKQNIDQLNFKNTDIQILIGPEGDFSLQEIELASQYNYLPVSLGRTRLRTETAGVVASALLINKL